MSGLTQRTNIEQYVVAGIISHTDLDGYGCEVVAANLPFMNVMCNQRMAGEENRYVITATNDDDSTVWHVGYDQLNLKNFKAWSENVKKRVKAYRAMRNDFCLTESDCGPSAHYVAFITDLLIPKDIFDYIKQLNKDPDVSFMVIDHHIQKCDMTELGDNAYVMSSVRDINGNSTPVCATMLMYRWVLAQKNLVNTRRERAMESFANNATLNAFVNHVNNYDTFTADLRADTIAQDLNDALYLIGGWEFCIHADETIEKDRGVRKMIPDCVQKIIRRNRENEEKIMDEAYKNTFIFHVNDRMFMLFIGSKINATSLSKYAIAHGIFEECPIIGLYNPINHTISLRSTGDVDVSELAKSFGGGGHKNAAGAVITDCDTMNRIMNEYNRIVSATV